MITPRLVACPVCGKLTAWSAENPFRPFCSGRCKTRDLAAWATEEYKVAQQEGSAGPSTGESSQ